MDGAHVIPATPSVVDVRASYSVETLRLVPRRFDASRFCRMRWSGEDFAISAPVDTLTIGEIDQISIRRPARFSRASFSVCEQAYIAAICIHDENLVIRISI